MKLLIIAFLLSNSYIGDLGNTKPAKCVEYQVAASKTKKLKLFANLYENWTSVLEISNKESFWKLSFLYTGTVWFARDSFKSTMNVILDGQNKTPECLRTEIKLILTGGKPQHEITFFYKFTPELANAFIAANSLQLTIFTWNNKNFNQIINTNKLGKFKKQIQWGLNYNP